MKNIKIPEIKIKLVFKNKKSPEELLHIGGVDDAYDAFKRVFDADTIEWKEEFIMLCLNTGNKLVGFYKVSSGGLTSTLADPRVIFSIALNCTATSIIIAHNHPSGSLNPSQADIAVTERLKLAGELLGITLVDHLIISPHDFYSFAEDKNL